MCTHQGFPLVQLPGANVFYTDEDVSTADGVITCRRSTTLEALLQITKAGRYLKRLADLP